MGRQNLFKIVIQKLERERRDYIGALCRDGRIIIKCISK
jgi:hypothetical protein